MQESTKRQQHREKTINICPNDHLVYDYQKAKRIMVLHTTLTSKNIIVQMKKHNQLFNAMISCPPRFTKGKACHWRRRQLVSIANQTNIIRGVCAIISLTTLFISLSNKDKK